MSKRRKLPNGMGSITKVPKTSSGKPRVSPYLARLPAYYNEEGKEIRKPLGYYKTYKEAQEALMSYNGLDKKQDKLIEIYNAYKTTKEYKDLSRKSQVKYDTAFKNFERLHGKKIGDITRYQLQQVIDEKVEKGYDTVEDGILVHKDYSRSTIRQLKTTIVKTFEFAIDNNKLQINIAKGLKVKGKISNKKEGKNPYSDQELATIFAKKEEIPFLKHILVMCYTGFRTGEYRKLKTTNIDFDRNEITGFGIKTNKGKERKMFILPIIKPILKELAEESKTGYIYEKDGKKVSDTVFYREYYKALKDAGLEKRIPYTGRYTFASKAHKDNVDKGALADLMGHESPLTTDEYYIINDDDYLQEEIQKMNN